MAQVYLISQKNKNAFYIGSSKNCRTRFSMHKYNTNNPSAKDYNCPLYKYIRDNGGLDNFSFIILEELGNIETKDLRVREQFFIELYEKQGYLINKHYENQDSYSAAYSRKKYYKNYINNRAIQKKSYEKYKSARLEYSKKFDSRKCFNKWTNKICTYSAIKQYLRKHGIKESPSAYLIKGALNG